MDNIHFHLFHLYDVNLRLSHKNNIEEEVKENKDNNNEYFDKEFSERLKIMSRRKEKSARFDRINNQSKYNIQSDNKYEEGTTALDSIYNQLCLKPYNIDENQVNNLSKYLRIQQFDTESMDLDLELNELNGNISKSASSQCVDALLQMFKAARSMFLYLYMFSMIESVFFF